MTARLRPDRVLDVVAARISRQRQRRSWRLPWRTPHEHPHQARRGLAAVLLVAVVGYNLLPGQPDRRSGSARRPRHAERHAGSRLAIRCLVGERRVSGLVDATAAHGAGVLPAGSHATRPSGPASPSASPEGWVNDGDEAGFFTLFPDTPANQAEFARSGALAQSIFMGPHTSPYFVCESVENNRGATAAEMVAAVTANEALATTGLVDVAIGGLTGKQFDVRLNPDWTGTCPRAGRPAGETSRTMRTRGILLDAPVAA